MNIFVTKEILVNNFQKVLKCRMVEWCSGKLNVATVQGFLLFFFCPNQALGLVAVLEFVYASHALPSINFGHKHDFKKFYYDPS